MRAPRLLVLDTGNDLAGQVERASRALRPHPEVTHHRSLDSVEKARAGGEHWDLLIAGATLGDEAGLRELRNLKRRMPDTVLILAFDQWRSRSLRETVRTGALDILRLPAKDEVVADAIEQALQLRPVLSPAPAVRSGRPEGRGRVVAVMSATGGCGKTFFATNLAYDLQTRLGERTCLVDLDLQFGELSTALRLRPRYTIADLVGHNDDEELAARLGEYAVAHDTGIAVLAAPDEPAAADNIDSADVGRVIEAARSQFDAVVIDTPASLTEVVLGAIEYADQLFVLATLDLPSIRNLGLLLKTLDALKVPEEQVKLVLNKVEPDVGIDVNQVSRYFPQGFSVVIPYGREANRALNMGMPMLAYAPRSEVSKAVATGLAVTIENGERTSEESTAPATTPERRRLLGRRAKKAS
ncbi:MAG: AAA family ATPase [Actinomycetota bacterium]